MRNSCSRPWIMALAVVTFVTLLPDTAFAAAPCTMRAPASTPAERAELWREAFEDFTAKRSGLTAEQTQFVGQALRLGDDIAALQEDERAQAAFRRKATRLMAQARELFSTNELGELFTSMGQTQIWLAEVVAAAAYCDCTGPGDCQMPGGPSGNCGGDCTTWDGTDGRRRNGICGPAAADAAAPATN